MKIRTPTKRALCNIAWTRCAMSLVCFLLFCGHCVAAAADPSTSLSESQSDPTSTPRTIRIEARAQSLLKQMGDYLKNAKAFTFQAESSYDRINRKDQMIRYGGIADVSVRRPNRLRAVFNGDERRTQTFYDGKTITIHNLAINMYAVADVPPDIDRAIDTIFHQYGFSVPLSDIIYADPYSILVADVIEGSWVGLHSIAGVPCNHLAFIQDTIDWQIWIEEGPRPVPRQILITYKDQPGSPKYLARMKSWNFQAQLPDAYFKFTPPAGSDEMEFLPPLEMDVNDE